MLLRFLSSRLRSPPPPPSPPSPLLLLLQPQLHPTSQTARLRSESDRRLGAKSSASSFKKSSHTASEAARSWCPRAGPGLLQPRATRAVRGALPAGRERRVTPRSRNSTEEAFRLSCSDRSFPSSPFTNHSGAGPRAPGSPIAAFVFCVTVFGLGGSRKAGKERERLGLRSFPGRIPEGGAGG